MLYILALVPGGTALFLWWWHLAWIVVILAAALYLPLFALQKWGLITARWRWRADIKRMALDLESIEVHPKWLRRLSALIAPDTPFVLQRVALRRIRFALNAGGGSHGAEAGQKESEAVDATDRAGGAEGDSVFAVCGNGLEISVRAAAGGEWSADGALAAVAELRSRVAARIVAEAQRRSNNNNDGSGSGGGGGVPDAESRTVSRLVGSLIMPMVLRFLRCSDSREGASVESASGADADTKRPRSRASDSCPAFTIRGSRATLRVPGAGGAGSGISVVCSCSRLVLRPSVHLAPGCDGSDTSARRQRSSSWSDVLFEQDIDGSMHMDATAVKIVTIMGQRNDQRDAKLRSRLGRHTATILRPTDVVADCAFNCPAHGSNRIANFSIAGHVNGVAAAELDTSQLLLCDAAAAAISEREAWLYRALVADRQRLRSLNSSERASYCVAIVLLEQGAVRARATCSKLSKKHTVPSPDVARRTLASLEQVMSVADCAALRLEALGVCADGAGAAAVRGACGSALAPMVINVELSLRVTEGSLTLAQVRPISRCPQPSLTLRASDLKLSLRSRVSNKGGGSRNGRGAGSCFPLSGAAALRSFLAGCDGVLSTRALTVLDVNAIDGFSMPLFSCGGDTKPQGHADGGEAGHSLHKKSSGSSEAASPVRNTNKALQLQWSAAAPASGTAPLRSITLRTAPIEVCVPTSASSAAAPTVLLHMYESVALAQRMRKSWHLSGVGTLQHALSEDADTQIDVCDLVRLAQGRVTSLALPNAAPVTQVRVELPSVAFHALQAEAKEGSTKHGMTLEVGAILNVSQRGNAQFSSTVEINRATLNACEVENSKQNLPQTIGASLLDFGGSDRTPHSQAQALCRIEWKAGGENSLNSHSLSVSLQALTLQMRPSSWNLACTVLAEVKHASASAATAILGARQRRLVAENVHARSHVASRLLDSFTDALHDAQNTTTVEDDSVSIQSLDYAVVQALVRKALRQDDLQESEAEDIETDESQPPLSHDWTTNELRAEEVAFLSMLQTGRSSTVNATHFSEAVRRFVRRLDYAGTLYPLCGCYVACPAHEPYDILGGGKQISGQRSQARSRWGKLRNNIKRSRNRGESQSMADVAEAYMEHGRASVAAGMEATGALLESLAERTSMTWASSALSLVATPLLSAAAKDNGTDDDQHEFEGDDGEDAVDNSESGGKDDSCDDDLAGEQLSGSDTPHPDDAGTADSISDEGKKAKHAGKDRGDDKSHQDRFWTDFTDQTGVTRNSLAGQAPAAVQRKLVRLSGSYDDARECWNRWVQPSLEAAQADIAAAENTNTANMGWMLSPLSCSVSSESSLDIDTQEVIAASVARGSPDGDGMRTSVSLKIGDVRASLLGDLLPHDLPLMSVDLTDFAFNVADESKTAAVAESTTVPTTLQACPSCLSFQVSVKRYNPRLGAVEQVVEPFIAEAALVRSFHTSANFSGVDVVVRAKESIHATADHEALRHAAALFGTGVLAGDASEQTLQKGEADVAAAQADKEGAFVLVNDAGCELDCAIKPFALPFAPRPESTSTVALPHKAEKFLEGPGEANEGTRAREALRTRVQNVSARLQRQRSKGSRNGADDVEAMCSAMDGERALRSVAAPTSGSGGGRSRDADVEGELQRLCAEAGLRPGAGESALANVRCKAVEDAVRFGPLLHSRKLCVSACIRSIGTNVVFTAAALSNPGTQVCEALVPSEPASKAKSNVQLLVHIAEAKPGAAPRVTIRSRASFINDTAATWRINFVSSDDTELRTAASAVLVRSGEQIAVPPDLAAGVGTIELSRPDGGATAMRVKLDTTMVSPLLDGKRRLLLANADGPAIVVRRATSNVALDMSAGIELLEFVLEPVLLLCNKSPFDLEWTCASSDACPNHWKTTDSSESSAAAARLFAFSTGMAEGRLVVGGSARVDDVRVSDTEPVFVAVRRALDDGETQLQPWSSSAPIQRRTSGTEDVTSYYVLYLAPGVSLTMRLESCPLSGSSRATFFAPVILENRTGLRLRYRCADNAGFETSDDAQRSFFGVRGLHASKLRLILSGGALRVLPMERDACRACSDSESKCGTLADDGSPLSWAVAPMSFGICTWSVPYDTVLGHKTSTGGVISDAGASFEFGIRCRRLPPPFEHTLSVTLAPKYTFHNHLPRAIEVSATAQDCPRAGNAVVIQPRCTMAVCQLSPPAVVRDADHCLAARLCTPAGVGIETCAYSVCVIAAFGLPREFADAKTECIVNVALGDTKRTASTHIDAAYGTGVAAGHAKARAVWLEELYFSEGTENADGDEDAAARHDKSKSLQFEVTAGSWRAHAELPLFGPRATRAKAALKSGSDIGLALAVSDGDVGASSMLRVRIRRTWQGCSSSDSNRSNWTPLDWPTSHVARGVQDTALDTLLLRDEQVTWLPELNSEERKEGLLLRATTTLPNARLPTYSVRFEAAALSGPASACAPLRIENRCAVAAVSAHYCIGSMSADDRAALSSCVTPVQGDSDTSAVPCESTPAGGCTVPPLHWACMSSAVPTACRLVSLRLAGSSSSDKSHCAVAIDAMPGVVATLRGRGHASARLNVSMQWRGAHATRVIVIEEDCTDRNATRKFASALTPTVPPAVPPAPPTDLLDGILSVMGLRMHWRAPEVSVGVVDGIGREVMMIAATRLALTPAAPWDTDPGTDTRVTLRQLRLLNLTSRRDVAAEVYATAGARAAEGADSGCAPRPLQLAAAVDSHGNDALVLGPLLLAAATSLGECGADLGALWEDACAGLELVRFAAGTGVATVVPWAGVAAADGGSGTGSGTGSRSSAGTSADISSGLGTASGEVGGTAPPGTPQKTAATEKKNLAQGAASLLRPRAARLHRPLCPRRPLADSVVAQTLALRIVGGRNLPTGCDPLVQVSLLHRASGHGSRFAMVSSHETEPKELTTDPVWNHAVRFDLPATDVRLQISAFDNSVARSSQLQIFALGAPAPKRRCLGSVMLSMLQLHAAFGAAPVKRPHGSSDTLQQLAEFERTGDGAPVVWFDLGEADAGAVGLQCRFWVTATSSG